MKSCENRLHSAASFGSGSWIDIFPQHTHTLHNWHSWGSKVFGHPQVRDPGFPCTKVRRGSDNQLRKWKGIWWYNTMNLWSSFYQLLYIYLYVCISVHTPLYVNMSVYRLSILTHVYEYMLDYLAIFFLLFFFPFNQQHKIDTYFQVMPSRSILSFQPLWKFSIVFNHASVDEPLEEGFYFFTITSLQQWFCTLAFLHLSKYPDMFLEVKLQAKNL